MHTQRRRPQQPHFQTWAGPISAHTTLVALTRGQLREEPPQHAGRGRTLSCPLIHFICVLELGHLREQGGAVQWPVVPPAGGLHQGREVGLWDVQPREPHHAGLTLGDLEGREGSWQEPGATIKCQGQRRPDVWFTIKTWFTLAAKRWAWEQRGAYRGKQSELPYSRRSKDLDIKEQSHRSTRSNLHRMLSRSWSWECKTQRPYKNRLIHLTNKNVRLSYRKKCSKQNQKTFGKLGKHNSGRYRANLPDRQRALRDNF